MKKLFTILAALCCGIILSGCKQQNEPTPSTDPTMPEIKRDYDVLTDWFAEAVKKCHPYMQTMWSTDVLPAEFNLMLVNAEKNRVVAITPDGKQEIAQQDWTPEMGQCIAELAGYAYTTYNNRPYTLILCEFESYEQKAMVMKEMFGIQMTDKDFVFQMLELFYHESFHHFVQVGSKGWQKAGGQYSREQTYPVNMQPRIYRKLALLALKKAWDDPASKSVQYARAKYWTAKYEKEYASEAAGIKSTDIDEASAEYFSREVVHAVFPSQTLLYDIDTYNLGSLLETESYMGSIALHLMRRENRLSEAVAACKNQTLTPINALLKDIAVPATYDESQDASDIARITKAAEAMNGDSSPYIAPMAALVKSHKEGKNNYLALINQASEYFQSAGNYKLADLPGFNCVVLYETTGEVYEISGLTILAANDYILIPLGDAGHLTLANRTSGTGASTIPNVTVAETAQLTAIQGEDGLVLKQLPQPLLIGKDNYGNTYYICNHQ